MQQILTDLKERRYILAIQRIQRTIYERTTNFRHTLINQHMISLEFFFQHS